ncbi:hypothetical protein [Jannaschia rubra]|uniref:Uncharacterized protein n=1 Tax=Jannaschia rubra TaxID=282197 RepID=A0A0M6XLW6_9RHOB|nr:hypothetical protein [Jannaschia rubra]CTQ31632.1 hypothetical protein JAN5088_00390 [Jannaschia rubra]SFF75984.1 hypothetical protein SAMN04488517_10129 [Jannaschia rubra]
MRILTPFLHDETATVALNWVVLTAGLTGLAGAAMVVFSGEIDALSFNVGAGMQNREQRPSWAYKPHDQARYDGMRTALATLTRPELDAVSAWGNALRPYRDTVSGEDGEAFDDLDAAITANFGDRSLERGTETTADEQALAGAFAKLGVSAQNGSGATGPT